MDSMDLEREKGITILAKNTSVRYGGVKLNIVDTPGHADFGGEVERARRWSTACCCSSTPAKGRCPRPASCCARRSKRPAVVLVINKVDRPDARIDEVVDEVYELFLDLDADEEQIEFPIVYCTQGRLGLARPAATSPAPTSSRCSEISSTSPPRPHREHPLQALVTNLDASPYLGRLAICRVRKGSPHAATSRLVQLTERSSASRSPSSSSPRRLGRVTRPRPGRRDHRRRRHRRGHHRRDARRSGRPAPAAGPHRRRAELSMTVGINTSPLAGARHQADSTPAEEPPRGRSWWATSPSGCSRQSAPTPGRSRAGASCSWRYSWRLMRREGFELTVGKPRW